MAVDPLKDHLRSLDLQNFVFSSNYDYTKVSCLRSLQDFSSLISIFLTGQVEIAGSARSSESSPNKTDLATFDGVSSRCFQLMCCV